MMDQTNNSKSSPNQKVTSTPTDPTTMVPSNSRAPPLEGGHYTKIGGMWTLKHEIRSPKFYELLIKTELKGDTALDVKNLWTYKRNYLSTYSLKFWPCVYHQTKANGKKRTLGRSPKRYP